MTYVRVTQQPTRITQEAPGRFRFTFSVHTCQQLQIRDVALSVTDTFHLIIEQENIWFSTYAS
jgi:hypothetical protein